LPTLGPRSLTRSGPASFSRPLLARFSPACRRRRRADGRRGVLRVPFQTSAAACMGCGRLSCRRVSRPRSSAWKRGACSATPGPRPGPVPLAGFGRVSAAGQRPMRVEARRACRCQRAKRRSRLPGGLPSSLSGFVTLARRQARAYPGPCVHGARRGREGGDVAPCRGGAGRAERDRGRAERGRGTT